VNGIPLFFCSHEPVNSTSPITSLEFALAKKEGLLLQRGKKLTSEQQREALELLQADMPFRAVARRFEINHETVR